MDFQVIERQIGEVDEGGAVQGLYVLVQDLTERRAAELRRRYPGVHVVASHELAPEFREYERASTTLINAYVGPLMDAYLAALDRGRRSIWILQSINANSWPIAVTSRLFAVYVRMQALWVTAHT